MVIRFILFISCFLLSEALLSQCTLTYAGKITDGDTKELLKGAVVELKDIGVKVVTDTNGIFMVKGLCSGHYDVTITHVGCQPLTTHIHINDDYEKEYQLPHAYNQLEAVTVVTNNINVINSSDLKAQQLDALKGLSLGETIKNIPGVSVLQTGTNIYKPVIHGLHSSRVLIINNGIRQEGQQWGNEHAPEIDANLANRISVVKGAATIRYGGDAIGGVVLVEPKLLRLVPGVGGEFNLGAFSNNRMVSFSSMIDGNFKKNNAISWRLQGTVKRGGNSKTPNYWLDNSGIQEYNFSVAAGYKKNNWGTDVFYSQFNTKLGIFSGSHIGNLTDLVNAINSVSPPDYITNAGFTYRIDRPYQKVQHHLLKSKTYLNTGAIGRLNVIASFQYNNRLEFDKKRFQSSEDVPQLDLSIGTAGLDILWKTNTAVVFSFLITNL
jgi:iron complex outermembrane recepter protein